MKERWKTIEGYPNYSVSDMGGVKRRYEKSGKERILRSVPNSRRYYLVKLCVDGLCKSVTVHKLVLEAFVNKRPDGMECNHRDGIKSHNELTNLEWTTPTKNQKHAYKMGLKNAKRGEKSGVSKLDAVDVISIRTLKEKFNYPQKQLAKLFEVSLGNIEAIVQRKTWKHLLEEGI